MPLQIDAVNKLIKVTSPDTEVTAQVLHDFVEDYMASPVGMANDSGDTSFLGDILKPEGKIDNPASPGNFSLIILLLNSEWQIQFWQGSGYTRVYGGKIVGGVNDEPLKATGAAGDISVLESPVDGTYTVVSTGSSLQPGEKAELSNINSTVNSNLKVVEGMASHAMMMRSIWAVICGLAEDADTGGPITETTTRIAYIGMDDSKQRVIFDVVNLFGTRTGHTLDMSP